MMVGLALALAMPYFALAQQTPGIEIQPAFLADGQLFAGESVQNMELSITNKTGATQNLRAYVRDIINVADDGSTPIYSAQILEGQTASWVKISQETFQLKNGETKKLPITLSIPKDPSPGSHFAGVLVSQEVDLDKFNTTGINPQVASIINFRTPGDAQEFLKLKEFSTNKTIYSKPQVEFKVVLENTGNVLEKPRGPLEVFNMSGKKVGQVTINNNEPPAGIFPKKDRTFKTTWDGGELGFGRYQATLGMAYGYEEKNTVSGVISFWVLPTHIFLPVAVGLLVLVLAIVVGVRYYIRKKLSGAKSPTVAAETASTPLAKLFMMIVFTIVFAGIFLGALFLFFG